jgi:hypothetical protein
MTTRSRPTKKTALNIIISFLHKNYLDYCTHVFSITPPTSIANLVGNWLDGIIKAEKANIRVGVCAMACEK